jgi:hypothetical protein
MREDNGGCGMKFQGREMHPEQERRILHFLKTKTVADTAEFLGISQTRVLAVQKHHEVTE